MPISRGGGGVKSILVGRLYGTSEIVAYYATDSVSGSNYIGVLLGFLSDGTVPTASVSDAQDVGGLIGYRNNGDVTNSYSTSSVARSSGTATTIGGLSTVSGIVTASYWDTSACGCTSGGSAGCATSTGGSDVVGKTTSHLQSIISYTGIYANWNANLDGQSGNDAPRDFGNGMQYPMLDYDGMSTDPQGAKQWASTRPS